MSRVARPSGKTAEKRYTDPAAGESAGADVVKQVVTSTAVAGIHKPAGVATSAFDAGRLAKPPRKPRQTPPLDLDSLVIDDGLPIPPPVIRNGATQYVLLLQRLKPGQSVALTDRQMRTLVSASKRVGIPVVTRQLADGSVRAWRMADADKSTRKAGQS